MALTASWQEQSEGTEEGPLIPRRRMRTEAELDMTPMIDCVFLLLIFFLVGSRPDLQTEVELPPARHGTSVDPTTAMVLTVAKGEGKRPALVYLADGKIGSPVPENVDEEEAAIVRFLEEGHRQGRSVVLLKGEKGVHHRDIARVAGAVSQVKGLKLELAVLEID